MKKGVEVLLWQMKKHQADWLILGQSEGTMGKIVQKVNQDLTKAGIKVILADETLSTKQAIREMIKEGLPRKARQDENAFAAAIILQRWLDEKKQE